MRVHTRAFAVFRIPDIAGIVTGPNQDNSKGKPHKGRRNGAPGKGGKAGGRHDPKRAGGPRASGPRPSEKAEPATAGIPARKIAVDILNKVIGERRPLDEELRETGGHPELFALEARDRALVRAILGTALRRRGQIAAILDRLLERPVPEKTGLVLDILHVAAAQILFMEIPDRAAVAIAVTIADRDGRTRRYKGLINAVLRRMTAEREELLAANAAPWRNVPVWLFAAWQKAYGEETALAIAAMHLHEPNLDLAVKDGADGWAERLGGRVIAGNTVRLVRPGGRVEALEGYNEGAWWVQDAAASLPARLLGDVAGKRVADLCAAPGGKTAQLCAGGARVTAIDISARRLERLSENLARLGFEADVVSADLAQYTPDAPFDAILLDAPCSATGTIRRHPDVAWNRRPGDVATLAEQQFALLERAADWLSPAGTLVYCTCSLEPGEGEDVITRFLAARPEFRISALTPEEVGIEGVVTPRGELRTLPVSLPLDPLASGGLDGFYAARLVRS